MKTVEKLRDVKGKVFKLNTIPVALFSFIVIFIYAINFLYVYQEKKRDAVKINNSILLSEKKLLEQEVYLHQEMALKRRVQLIGNEITSKTKVPVCLTLSINKEVNNFPAYDYCTQQLDENIRTKEIAIGDRLAMLYVSFGPVPFNIQDIAPYYIFISILIAFILSFITQYYYVNKLIFNIIEPLVVSSIQIEKEAAIGEVASQVAHDIRSPLAALDVVMKDLQNLPDVKKKLIRHSVNRIHDIANDLLGRHRSAVDDDTFIPISSIISSIISEKRAQFRHINDVSLFADLSKSYGIFSSVSPVKLNRVMSNILNNAFEALDGNGLVKVVIFQKDQKIKIDIWNDGKLIPSEILKKLGQKGVTYGKHNGNGLGVYYSKKIIESCGGTLTYASCESQKTTATISLPICKRPSWFVGDIKVNPGDTVIIVDDDLSIHQVWTNKFADEELLNVINLVSLNNPAALIEWYGQNNPRKCHFFIDYEYAGQKLNGVDLIKSLGIARDSVLVTSHFDDKHIQETATTFKGLLPKSQVSLIPLKISYS